MNMMGIGGRSRGTMTLAVEHLCGGGEAHEVQEVN